MLCQSLILASILVLLAAIAGTTLILRLDEALVRIWRAPLAGHTRELLAERGRVRRIDTKLVFPRPDGCRPVDVRYAWQLAAWTGRLG